MITYLRGGPCCSHVPVACSHWFLPRARQVRVVTDMVEGGLAPDEATYAGILHACQRANEAELAFDVLRRAGLPSGMVTSIWKSSAVIVGQRYS